MKPMFGNLQKQALCLQDDNVRACNGYKSALNDLITASHPGEEVGRGSFPKKISGLKHLI